MATLTGTTIQSTYDSLLKVTDNDSITGSLKRITDGLGNNTPLYLSSSAVEIVSTLNVTSTITGSNLSGTNTGDETNATIKTKLGAASASQDGYLTSTDWNTFSNKIAGSGTINTIPKFSSSSSIGNSNITDNGTIVSVGINTSITGTLQAGDSSTLGLPSYGSTPTSIIGKAAGGVLDLRNTSTPVNAGDTAGTLQFSVKGDASPGYSVAKIDVITQVNTSTGASGGGNMRFFTSGGGVGVFPTERMRITNAGQLKLAGYTTTSSFSGTAAGYLAFDSSGNILTVSASSGGITSLNALTASTQTFAVGTSGTDFAINSATSTHTFNLPTASASNRGALSSADWTTFNSKENALTFSSPLSRSTNTISIPAATTSVNGYLTSTDWNTFNNKQNALTNPITGTGTTNYVPKFTGSTAIGNSLIFDNGTNVGIGTTTPSAKLSVAGDINLLSTGAGIGCSTESVYFGGTVNGNYLAFGTNNTERARITNGGNVGIGTSSPTQKLDINGNAVVLGFLQAGDTSILGAPSYGVIPTAIIGKSPAGVLDIRNTNGTVVAGDTAGIIQFSVKGDATPGYAVARIDVSTQINTTTGNSGGGNMKFLTSGGGTGVFPAERMRITNAGNVGIGTTAPATLLDLNSSSTNDRLTLSHTGSPKAGFGVTSGDIAYIYHHPSATFPMWISAAGNFGIGTTSPSYQLQLSADSAAKPTSALWTIASDSRIKENITPYSKGLKELMLINPINYDYNGLGGFKKGKGGVGIIAQEILDILPDSVSSVKGKLNEWDKEETDILNFNGHELTYVLINAIKEQQAQIEELKAKLK